MADVPPQTERAGAGADRILAGALMRAGALAGGMLFGVGVLAVRLVTGHGIDLFTLVLLYLATLLFVWGATGFTRKLSLSFGTLLLFAAAVFGVLFLAGYLLTAVAGPFLGDIAMRFVGFVNLANLAFYLFAVMTVAGAGGCAFSTNIIYSAWSLLFAFMGVAGLYVCLGADFPAVAQVLIYVGGILVLILFAIMLTKQIGEDPKLTNAHLGLPAGAILGAAAVATLSYMAVMAPWKVVEHPSYASSARGLGVAFLTDYLLPFEVASVVLLAALVGSVVIARKEIKETGDATY
jgi:NAD(P)H-quinone oxidoreductase subunit 6